VLGELKRHFRDNRWSLHVGRRAQEHYLTVRDTVDECTMALGRAPTVEELASITALSEKQVSQALETANALHPESLDSLRRGDSGQWTDPRAADNDDDHTDRLADKLALFDALQHLPERERMMMAMRFAEGLTQTEIARRLGISQMQVSRMLAWSLRSLRQILADRTEG
jgi:RNA polymerase sigma-B factor